MEQNQRSGRNLIPLAIVVAGAMVAGAIYFGGNTSGRTITTNPSGLLGSAGAKVSAVTSEDHILGSQNARVVVVEYSDTECPFCKDFHETMHQIIDSYSGNSVAWVYRHFPIASLHALAAKEAEATECATELGGNPAFWSYIDKVFEKTNSNDSLDPAQLPVIAQELGLNGSAFNTCLSSGKYEAKIKKSIEEAVKSGAQGTPYSVILKDGKNVGIINGAESFASVKSKIDAALR